MTAVIAWAATALAGSTALLVVVLAVRHPARRWLGSPAAYWLWGLPVIPLIVPPLPVTVPLPVAHGALPVFAGPYGPGPWPVAAAGPWHIGTVAVIVWLAGAAALFAWQVGRHTACCRRLLATAADLGVNDRVRVVAAAVDGPLAFGVWRPIVAVPRDFADRYDVAERRLVLAHELAHHARGDLIANWLSLAVLALHWWNPVAWVAIRAFRDDQEFAVDACVVADCAAAERPAYARVIARAAGLGSLPAANLTRNANLKGRLMRLATPPVSRRRHIFGSGGVAIAAAATLAVTMSASAAPPAGRQAVTIGVKPDGSGGYALIVGGEVAAPGAPSAGGATLPADFSPHGGCDLKPSATPRAMVIKGVGDIETYSVMCASATPVPVRTTLAEGLASLRAMRGAIATQPASAVFPESERRYALAKVDRSIHEVEATLARAS